MFNKSLLIPSVAMAVLATLGASQIQAQEQEQEQEWEFQAGSMLLTQSSVWEGGNNLVSLFPYFGASYGNWRFNVETPVAYQSHLTDNLSYSVALRIRDEGYNSDDFNLNSFDKDPIFEGYRTPDTEALASLGLQYGWFSFEASRDISNQSDANSASLSVEMPVYDNEDDLSITMGISAEWYDDKYVNYYYGVAQEQVNTQVGRTAYNGDAAINYSLSFRSAYALNESWMLMADARHTLLDDNITDSPLVGSDSQSSFALMIIYQF